VAICAKPGDCWAHLDLSLRKFVDIKTSVGMKMFADMKMFVDTKTFGINEEGTTPEERNIFFL
jgi:hypothetical protein